MGINHSRALLAALLTAVLCTDATGQGSVPSSVVLRFGGDCLLAAHYESSVGPDVGRAFRGFTLLAEADIALVNLESPITIRGTKVPKPFNFRMHPRYLAALSETGIDVVSIANNHIWDYGREGLFDTILYLDSVGIQHVGAGITPEEARRAVLLSVKGRKVGFLAYYGGGEAPVASGTRPGVAGRDLASIVADIRRLRKSDDSVFVVVVLHWGAELAPVPDRLQQDFGRKVIDAGADAVIGHHPHVLQGIERYGRGVIVYSLGNFIFGGNSRATYDTGLFEIRLGAQGATYAFIPVRVEHWIARRAEGEDARRITQLMRDRSASLRYNLFTNTGNNAESK